MDPRNFLDVAFDLAGEFREADWRSAVSRAYYAAFHVAGQLLQRCSFVVPQGDQAHGFSWIRLANCGDTSGQQAGNELRRLRGARNRADYALAQPFTQMYALDFTRVAEHIIRSLDRIAASPTLLNQVTDTMRVYERDVLGEVTWQPPPP
jgi:hypothetical protein